MTRLHIDDRLTDDVMKALSFAPVRIPIATARLAAYYTDELNPVVSRMHYDQLYAFIIDMLPSCFLVYDEDRSCYRIVPRNNIRKNMRGYSCVHTVRQLLDFFSEDNLDFAMHVASVITYNNPSSLPLPDNF